MLYAPGTRPYDSAAVGEANFVSFAEIPQPAAYGLVAVFCLSLAARLAEASRPCVREYDKRQGGWHRLSGISLPGGRFAFVQEFEHHPGDVQLSLSVWRDVHLYRQDFFAARALLAVPDGSVTLCDGPFQWR